MQKYSVNQYQIANILSLVREGSIAIPEIQRPFVWEVTKIRDLIDSFYRGYPVGYIIVWQNPDVRLKDSTTSFSKKILIDGQQRITAIKAAIVGDPIVNKEYKEIRVRIAFNPQTGEFETLTPVLAKNPSWIPDISELMKEDASFFDMIDLYLEANPNADKKTVQSNIQQLVSVKSKQIGVIELESTLDIETVTEIFVRINSQGVPLSSADFAMSKIAAYGDFGMNLRKLIDYFCHLAVAPQFYKHISENDASFAKSGYLDKLSWLKNDSDNLYDPTYADLLRTVSLSSFNRGRVSDLVSLLSGRDFEARTYKAEIAEKSFKQLEEGVLHFSKETNFQRFIMVIKSAGYIRGDMITAQNALNFAYGVFLKLRSQGLEGATIERFVRRWFVMSMLTARHSGSFEGTFESDIKRISSSGIEEHLKTIEDAELTEGYWSVRLPQELEKYSMRNPFANVYLAAQIKAKDKGFLSKEIGVNEIVAHVGDVHHLFPRDYLVKAGFTRQEYNQIANMAFMQTEINIAVGNKAPKDYMKLVKEQTEGGKMKYGGINTPAELKQNLAQNCIPEIIFQGDSTVYEEFLLERRKLMAQKIKDYYEAL